MNSEVQKFVERLADVALAQDWAGVHSLLAPWLQSRFGVEDVREFFERDYLRLLSFVEITELQYPTVPYVSGNDSSLEDLREKTSWLPRPRPIPLEVTAGNFKQWFKLQLQCSPEQADEIDVDYLTEIWLIVVEHASELRVGYWVHDPYEVAPEGWPTDSHT